MTLFQNVGNLKIEPAFDWPGRNVARLSATYVVTTWAAVLDTHTHTHIESLRQGHIAEVQHNTYSSHADRAVRKDSTRKSRPQSRSRSWPKSLLGDGDATHPHCWYADVINETCLRGFGLSLVLLD